MELAVSEFHLPAREFLFDWTLPTFMVLLNTRIARNQELKATDNAGQSTPKPEEETYSSLGKLRAAFS